MGIMGLLMKINTTKTTRKKGTPKRHPKNMSASLSFFLAISLFCTQPCNFRAFRLSCFRSFLRSLPVIPCLVHCLQSLFSSFVKGSNCMSARLCWFSSFFRLHSYSFFFLSYSLCWIRRWLRCCSETPDSFHFSQSRFSSSSIGSALSIILSSFKCLYSLMFYHHFLFCSLRRFVRKNFYPSPVQRAVFVLQVHSLTAHKVRHFIWNLLSFSLIFLRWGRVGEGEILIL